MINSKTRDETIYERFQRDGFVGPIKVYEPEEARSLLAAIRLANLDRSQILFDNDVNYDRHFDIEPLSQHISHPKIVEAVAEIMGPNLLCWRSEFFPKFPGDAGTEWHQVSNYQYATGTPMLQPLDTRPPGPLDITVWTCFTETRKQTACMKFLPGSHHKTYYDEGKSTQRGRDTGYRSVQADGAFFGYDFQDFKVDPSWIPDEDAAVAMEMEPGECVIFSARCVHASYPNTSRRKTRFAITSRYTTTDVRVYADMPKFTAHGGDFDLRNYGCVLVSGEDSYGHNRLRRENNRGQPFSWQRESEKKQ